jgi:hypothetical protein
MPRPAQCEKAVTISEPMGRSHRDAEVPVGSKAPMDFGIPVTGSLDPRASASPGFCLLTALHPVFNGLHAKKVERAERWGAPEHYLGNGHVESTEIARFGPNFVTILPTGVCVCSI